MLCLLHGGTGKSVNCSMNTDQLWKAALGQLELRVSRGNFLTWFQATKISEKQGGMVVVETPNAFTYEWLSKKYHRSVLEVLHNPSNQINKEKSICLVFANDVSC